MDMGGGRKTADTGGRIQYITSQKKPLERSSLREDSEFRFALKSMDEYDIPRVGLK